MIIQTLLLAVPVLALAATAADSRTSFHYTHRVAVSGNAYEFRGLVHQVADKDLLHIDRIGANAAQEKQPVRRERHETPVRADGERAAGADTELGPVGFQACPLGGRRSRDCWRRRKQGQAEK